MSKCYAYIPSSASTFIQYAKITELVFVSVIIWLHFSWKLNAFKNHLNIWQYSRKKAFMYVSFTMQ